MARKLIFKENQLSSQTTPAGYKILGINGTNFAEKNSDGVISPLGGTGYSGPGASGSAGTSGTSGSSGTSGTSGSNGSSGTSGTSGSNGSSGTSGTSGLGTNGTSGTSGISGGSPVYNVYTAIIRQETLDSIPTATVLQNTLGVTLTWSRSSTGFYLATAPSGIFLVDKVWILITLGGGIGAGWATQLIAGRQSNNEIFIATTRTDSTSTFDDLAGGGQGNRLHLASIEIRVYP